MKLVGYFSDFLRETVNLNQTRIDNLESSVESIKNFIRESDWEPRVWKFIEQGSWAHNTIIKPVDNSEFDADLLVVVDEVDGWSAADYVKSLGQIFKDSELYKDKAKTWDYCVTISYAGQRKIDIAPCVRGREIKDRLEVCNRKDDAFERSEPIDYTDWVNEKNGYSGNNSFRKVTRMLKYLRDIRKDFECSSIVLTTLVGQRIDWFDKGSNDFKDVPATLKTVVGRLDSWLQARPRKPAIMNPKLPSEDFASKISQEEYEILRETMHEIRGRIDVAFDMEGTYASIEAWREVFGSDFAKGVTIVSKALVVDAARLNEGEDEILSGVVRENAAHSDSIVDLIKVVGRWLWKPAFDRPAHMTAPPWKHADVVSDRVQVFARFSSGRHSPDNREIQDFEELPRRGGIWFDVLVNGAQALPQGYSVRYRVTNTGAVAMALKKGRGWFEVPQQGTKRWEELQYRGVHLVEAFVIRDSDNRLVGQSLAFHVMIQ